MGKCSKGKCNILNKRLSCKQDKSDDYIPRPPTPPPPSYSKSCPPQKFGYNNAAASNAGMASNLTTGTFGGQKADQVYWWSIGGCAGIVDLNKDLAPMHQYGKLQMLNMLKNGNHNFDMAMVKDVGDLKIDSGADKKKDKDNGAKNKKKREYKAYNIPPPSPTPKLEEVGDGNDDSDEEHHCADDDDGLNCTMTNCGSNQPVRRIKRLGDNPLCWGCVCQCFHQDAVNSWNGN